MTEVSKIRPSRRALITTLALAGGAAAVAGPLTSKLAKSAAMKPAASWWDRSFFSLEQGAYDEWAGIAGQVFTVQTEAGPSLMKLLAVTPLAAKGTRPPACTRKLSFAAMFEGSLGAATGNRIYMFKHPTYGTLPIFVSEAYAVRGAKRLMAVFN